MKKFMCYWSAEGYQETLELNNVEFFAEDMGYSMLDISQINNLDIGETYRNHAHGLNSHIITRVL